MSQTHIFGWFACDRIAGKLGQQISEFQRNKGILIDYIVAPSRGGLVPGVMLSHQLNKNLVPFSWSTRDSMLQEHRSDIAEDLAAGKNILLVDDINDSSNTYLSLIKDWDYNYNSKGKLYFACMFERYTAKCPADFVGSYIKDDGWVSFPWE